ncbi:hypothetical protein KAH81_09835, partial [bacterium]|nr:hypothetical protein [bacterium]
MRIALAVLIFIAVAYAQHPSYDPRYHTVSEVIEEITALADTYSTYCSLESLGHSGVDSVVIWGLKISDNPMLDEDETCVEFHGGQHGDEPNGVETCMWMMQDLLHRLEAGDSEVTAWWEELEIWIIPQMNPDGRIMCLDSGYTEWRKTKRDLDSNGIYDAYTDGVDPNRNWDYLWDEYTSSDLDNTKGPYPFSEQCVITMRDFYERERPLVAVDFHSPDSTGGNKMWICWWFNEGEYYGYAPDAINNWLDIRDDYADATLDEEGSVYARGSSYHNKPKLQTWTYYELGICSIVLEITNQCFWTGEIIDTIAARVGHGSYYLLDRAMRQMLVTHVIDSASGVALTDATVEVVQLEHAYFPPRKVDPIHATNRRWLDDGYYTVYAGAPGYYPETIDSIYVSEGAPTKITIELVRDYAIRETDLPSDFSLSAHPNPFNSSVKITINCHSRESENPEDIMAVEIFDLSGRQIYVRNTSNEAILTLTEGDFSPSG